MSALGGDHRSSIVVVGAGMAGLAAAWHLQRAGLDVTVLERDTRVGGRVRTEQVQGFSVEAGAQFLTNFYPRTLNLVGKLGLEAELQRVQGGSAIVHAGLRYPVWPPRHLAGDHLVSAHAKLSLLPLVWSVLCHWRELDLDAFHRAHRLDTRSAADLVRARVDDEAVERLLRPGLEGFVFSTPEQTSQALLLALVKGAIGLRSLVTLRPGLDRLPKALSGELAVRRNAEVLRVRADTSGGCEVVAAVDGVQRRLAADGVVCATRATAVPVLFADLDRRRTFFDAVRYLPVVRAAVAVRRRLPSDFYGLLFPRQESPCLALATIESAKHPDRVPPGGDLVVLYASPQAVRDLLGQDDATVRDALLSDLARAGPAFDLASDELFTLVQRWEEALPEFGVGHFRRLRAFAAGEVEWGRVVFAGDYLGGPLIEGAVTSGLQAADRLLRRLREDRGPQDGP